MQQSAIANLAPLAALVVLLEVAVGTSIVSHLIDRLGKVGRGYIGTTSLICAAMAAIALLISASLGDPSQIQPGLTWLHYFWTRCFRPLAPMARAKSLQSL